MLGFRVLGHRVGSYKASGQAILAWGLYRELYKEYHRGMPGV